MEFEFARNKQVSKQAFGVKGFLESRPQERGYVSRGRRFWFGPEYTSGRGALGDKLV